MDAPDRDEFEVNLFGPGYGESILVHLGEDNWLINDSCLDSEKRNPAALTYLQSIGIDVRSSVKVIIASHWHDDHIRGLSKVVEVCESAEFCCSIMLQSEQFMQLVASASDDSVRLGSGLREFRRIIDVVTARKREHDRKLITWAKSDVLVWRHQARPDVCVYALSPSDDSITRSLQEIGQLIDNVRASGNRVPSTRPNDTSVVSWVDFGFDRVLLSGDLENISNDPNRGWLAICRSTTRPVGQAGLVKVAHHGSITGYHPQVHERLVTAKPVSVLTPFNRGRVALPTPDDRQRICAQSSAAYSTVPPGLKKVQIQDRAVTRTLREMGVEIRLVDPKCGHIRLRRKPNEDSWRVALFDQALELSAQFAAFYALSIPSPTRSNMAGSVASKALAMCFSSIKSSRRSPVLVHERLRFAKPLGDLDLGQAGQFQPNKPLPAEGDLADEFGVSLGTIRRARRLLEEEGLVTVVPSKGTYVVNAREQGKEGS